MPRYLLAWNSFADTDAVTICIICLTTRVCCCVFRQDRSFIVSCCLRNSSFLSNCLQFSCDNSQANILPFFYTPHEVAQSQSPVSECTFRTLHVAVLFGFPMSPTIPLIWVLPPHFCSAALSWTPVSFLFQLSVSPTLMRVVGSCSVRLRLFFRWALFFFSIRCTFASFRVSCPSLSTQFQIHTSFWALWVHLTFPLQNWWLDWPVPLQKPPQSTLFTFHTCYESPPSLSLWVQLALPIRTCASHSNC